MTPLAQIRGFVCGDCYHKFLCMHLEQFGMRKQDTIILTSHLGDPSEPMEVDYVQSRAHKPYREEGVLAM